MAHLDGLRVPGKLPFQPSEVCYHFAMCVNPVYWSDESLGLMALLGTELLGSAGCCGVHFCSLPPTKVPGLLEASLLSQDCWSRLGLVFPFSLLQQDKLEKHLKEGRVHVCPCFESTVHRGGEGLVAGVL